MYAASALGLALALAAPAPKEAAPKKDPPAIVGEWACVGFVGGGRGLAPGERPPNIVVEFTADGKFRLRQDGEAYPEGTYKTDPTKDPAEVDYGTGKTKTNHGIYKVEKDTLILCVAEGGGTRPTAFESLAGTRVLLLSFKPVKKKD